MSPSETRHAGERAIALIRVSQRDDDALSPEVQKRSVVKQSSSARWRLDEHDILDENVDDNGRTRNVSASWTLDDRPKLRYAIEEIEATRARVIVCERFDRLFRNELLRRVVVKRIESAGGELWSEHSGQMTNQKGEGKLAHNLQGDVSEYTLETAKERSWDAVELAIENGTFPGPVAPPGYKFGISATSNHTLVVDLDVAPIMVRAFERRDDGAVVREVADFLSEHGIRRSLTGVRKLLGSRVYLGELHAGNHTPNPRAFTPIVARDLFERVQRRNGTAGRKLTKSSRLLARQQVLHCESCDGRMSVGHGGRGHAFYNCANERCPKRQSIMAHFVESAVHEIMPALIANRTGRASQIEQFEIAKLALERAQTAYDAFVEDYDPTEPADVKRKREISATLKDARREIERFEGARSAIAVPIDRAWHELTLDEQQAGIRLHIARVVVGPGRGADRISIDTLDE